MKYLKEYYNINTNDEFLQVVKSCDIDKVKQYVNLHNIQPIEVQNLNDLVNNKCNTVLKYLLSNKLVTDDLYFMYVQGIKVNNFDIVSYIIQNYNIDILSNLSDLQYIFFEAADKEVAKNLFKLILQTQKFDWSSFNNSLLGFAIKAKWLDIVKLLLSNDKVIDELNSIDMSKSRSLFWWSINESTKDVYYLSELIETIAPLNEKLLVLILDSAISNNKFMTIAHNIDIILKYLTDENVYVEIFLRMCKYSFLDAVEQYLNDNKFKIYVTDIDVSKAIINIELLTSASFKIFRMLINTDYYDISYLKYTIAKRLITFDEFKDITPTILETKVEHLNAKNNVDLNLVLYTIEKNNFKYFKILYDKLIFMDAKTEKALLHEAFNHSEKITLYLLDNLHINNFTDFTQDEIKSLIVSGYTDAVLKIITSPNFKFNKSNNALEFAIYYPNAKVVEEALKHEEVVNNSQNNFIFHEFIRECSENEKIEEKIKIAKIFKEHKDFMHSVTEGKPLYYIVKTNRLYAVLKNSFELLDAVLDLFEPYKLKVQMNIFKFVINNLSINVINKEHEKFLLNYLHATDKSVIPMIFDFV